jgi:ABC-type lipoprotein export system ATPase subunit
MEIIKVEDLVRNYRKSILKENENDVKVLKKISFDVYKGEFVGIMGKSGCGKTTLLKTLGMIDKPNEGKIYFMGEDTSGFCGDKLADIRNKKIGFIFQDFYLMDSLSIEENIMLPMLIGKKRYKVYEN